MVMPSAGVVRLIVLSLNVGTEVVIEIGVEMTVVEVGGEMIMAMVITKNEIRQN
jgi:hypothetical protein